MTESLALTKAELRAIGARLLSLLPPGPRPLSVEEIGEVHALIAKTRTMLTAANAAPERGRLVLSWRIPKDLAPTQNDLRGIKPWRLKKIKAALTESLTALLPAWPDALTHGSTRQRWVRTTRFSPQKPDELSCDATGFKVAIDMLVTCGVLAADTQAGLFREAHHAPCKRGETHGLLELFLTAEEQIAAPAPAFAPVTQVVYTPGVMTRALRGR